MSVLQYLVFVKWLLYSCLIGIVVGGVAISFHYGIDWATQLRGAHPNAIFFLPLGGVAIVLFYRVCHMEKDRGTNLVLVAVREAEPLKLRTTPLIYFSTILTHLVGGSAGREGAALQLGGSLAAWLGRQIRLDAKDSRVMVMCGMAAAFSALFGTPLTAAIFAMEVVSVGVMYYAAMVPCVLSSLIAFQFARVCGLHATVGYSIPDAAVLSPLTMVQAAGLGVLCALVSILFCEVIHTAPKLYAKAAPNPLVRAALGGILVLGLTLLVGSQDYNGAGDFVIRRLLAGETIPQAFLLKILFTAVTLGAEGARSSPYCSPAAPSAPWPGPFWGCPTPSPGPWAWPPCSAGPPTAPSPLSCCPTSSSAVRSCPCTPCAVWSPISFLATMACTASRRSSIPNTAPSGSTRRHSKTPDKKYREPNIRFPVFLCDWRRGITPRRTS